MAQLDAFNAGPWTDHGTQVASVAAAGAGGSATTGVASEAEIYSVRWHNNSFAAFISLGEIETYQNSYASIASDVVASGASVFNVSFGYDNVYNGDEYLASGNWETRLFTLNDRQLEELRAFQTMINSSVPGMAGSGMVGVFANENAFTVHFDDGDGQFYDNTLFEQGIIGYDSGDSFQTIAFDPAFDDPRDPGTFFALLPQINDGQDGVLFNDATGESFDFSGTEDHILAVSAVDGSNQIASMPCGQAMNYCVVAPGVAIGATDADGGTSAASGTSFAAPIVSGMVAVIRGLYPFLDSDEVVDLGSGPINGIPIRADL